MVHALFEEPNIRFEDGPTVWMALNDYRESDGADFADALIINKARAVAKAQGRSSVPIPLIKPPRSCKGQKHYRTV